MIPWKGAIVAPSSAPPLNSAVPDAELILKWAHGFRAQDATNNLVYSKSGDAVYTTAGVGVVLNIGANKQKFNVVRCAPALCIPCSL